MKLRWKAGAAALLLLLPLVLTGCGTEELEEDQGIPMLEETAPPKKEIILPDRFTLPFDPNTTLDPIACPDGMQQVVGALLYEGLFALNEKMEPKPCLCTKYSYDPVTFTYVFTLRPGVTFWDGTPLTGYHAAASLLRAKGSARYGSRLYQMVTAVGAPESVTVTLDRANKGFPALLDIPIIKAGTETAKAPVGTGPYCFQEEDSVPSLRRSETWWNGGGQPVEEIALLEAENRDIMLYQFSSHDVQLITADIVGTQPVSATGNVTYRDADTTVMQYVGFNIRRPIFQSPALRQALCMGVNRSGLISGFLSGHGQPAQFPVSPVSPLYPDGLEEPYAYEDYAEAMDKAGFCTGTPRSVTMVVNQESSFKTAAAESVARALSAFDLQVSLRVLPWPEYVRALQSGNFDLYYGEVRLSADWDLTHLVGSGGSMNYGGWSDPVTDRLLAAYAAADDRVEAMERLCARLANQAPIMPICFKSTSVLCQSGVVEDLTPTAVNPFYGLKDLEIKLSGK